MRTYVTAAAVLAAFAAAGGGLAAHHSFAAFYLESDTIEVSGTVVEFQYTNPHAWLFVSGSEKSAVTTVKTYAAEWVGTAALERADIEKDTLRPGDKVTIWGSPSKNPSEAKIHLKRIERNDGWSWRGRSQTR